ncbi:MAG: rod shape-determining protein MreC [Prolixibacteraceae bacterium]|nr:rod shape-determining protein MreC [Prolixibacteraceae bacterium]
MRSLFRYLIKHYPLVLFLLLEITSLAMVVSYNNYQRVIYLNSANWLSGTIYKSFSAVTDYFLLAKINKQIAGENVQLRTMLDIPEERVIPGTFFADSGQFNAVHRYYSAKVINNSVNKPFNYITLNKGKKDGIKPDQGIISASGIVGVIINVSESYSVGLSLLNSQWSVSAKLKKNEYFGSLSWNGHDYRYANLKEIPLHVDISVGDTVITSGFSSVFPEGILIGTIKDFSRPEGENYYSIDIQLSTDFKKLSYVEVVENTDRNEIETLERISGDD